MGSLKKAFWISTLILFAITGCGGDQSISNPPSESALVVPPANVFGDWNGDLFNSVSGRSGALRISIAEASVVSPALVEGGTPAGTFEISGDILLASNCFEDARRFFSLQRIAGNTITITVSMMNSPGLVRLEGTVEGSRMAGTFEIRASDSEISNPKVPCSGDTGTWSVVNINPPRRSFLNLINLIANVWDFTGDWKGSGSNSGTGEALDLALSIDRLSVKVDAPIGLIQMNGRVSVSGTGCFDMVKGPGMPFSQSFDGESIDFVSTGFERIDPFTLLRITDIRIHFKGTVEDGRITGTLEIKEFEMQEEGPCSGNTGTWDVSK